MKVDFRGVYRLMVDKDFQGKGIGKAALELMISEMVKTLGAKRIVVGYHPENKGAHALYRRSGFVDSGKRFGKELTVIKEIS